MVCIFRCAPVHLVIFIGLLTGCNVNQKPVRELPGVSAAAPQKYSVNEKRAVDKKAIIPAGNAATDPELEACKAGLSALSLISSTAYAKRRSEFDALLRNAAVYARVRGSVDQATRETLDPLYQYRTKQLCLRISQDVAEGLMTRAESLAGSRTKG